MMLPINGFWSTRMVTKKKAGAGGKEASAEEKLQEAQARLKTASDRHEAVVSVLSRLGTSPADKRMAQNESKKIEHELREAKRLVQEAEATTKKA
jgi:uncharacterized protein with von Willebrand factor type A (vWA) domain